MAVAGMGLLFLAAGVRRGGRRAWATALGLLVGSAVFHLAKGVEVGAAVIALAVRTAVLLPVLARSGIDRGSCRLIALFGPRGLSSLLLVLLPVFSRWMSWRKKL